MKDFQSNIPSIGNYFVEIDFFMPNRIVSDRSPLLIGHEIRTRGQGNAFRAALLGIF